MICSYVYQHISTYYVYIYRHISYSHMHISMYVYIGMYIKALQLLYHVCIYIQISYIVHALHCITSTYINIYHTYIIQSDAYILSFLLSTYLSPDISIYRLHYIMFISLSYIIHCILYIVYHTLSYTDTLYSHLAIHACFIHTCMCVYIYHTDIIRISTDINRYQQISTYINIY